ncbi:MAG: hypothetical protein JWM55_731 [Acidimicrobiaceae bacterium]|nr:hypothetical protein [Acidimicrobiaceae bacterium]
MAVVLALTIALGVVVLLLVVGIVLRIRKLRRDEMRELAKPVERRLMAPPPSPYAPSKGFRLLDESGQPIARPPQERPRLDPHRHYVFSELGAGEETVSSHPRHDDQWFLSRSSQHSTLSSVLRRLGVLVIIALIAVVVATYYVHHRSPKSPHSSTTTSTSLTTTTTFPTSFAPSSASGEEANYEVPAATYQVAVIGLKGPTRVVFDMGPSNTLEWQGTVSRGKVEALTMTGDSRITIGSPSDASVHVKGSPVTFPSSLPATLVLVFSSTASRST